ncbi:MAG: hypothetical protein ABSB89_04720 [Candidatus Bathyarchaeia archaeon]
METRRKRKRFSFVVFIVLTLFLVTGLFSSDVFAAAHDSFLNQPSTTIAAPPVLLYAGTAGTSTIYANSTSAMVNVAAPENQYVTQQSNVDGVGDVGTHSNFTAQQYGPDNIYDNLTEANTNAAAPYIPITFNNTVSSATPNPFQEEITWNPSSYTSYEASNLGNIRFYNDSGFTTPLYAWLESCTPSLSNAATNATAWIKLTTQIAGNGGTQTIYMAFLSTATSFDGSYWGVAPNLSSPYGQYDNGANVFSFYDNFTGTSLNSRWTIFGSSQGTVSVNNGVTLTSSSSTLSIGIFASYTPPTTGIVTETYFNATSPTAGYRIFDGYGMTSTSTAEQNGYIGILQAGGGSTLRLSKMVSGTQTTLVSATDALTAGNNYTSSLLWQSSTLTMADLTNSHSSSTTDTTYSLSTMTQVAMALGATSGTKYVTFWFRVRQSPPSGVMPTTSFGSVASSSPNYKLDIEEQWTNTNTTATNEELDIYTGAFSTPASILSVQWYNTTSSSWLTIISSLNASTWNNVTVVNYLTSSTFTIQFVNTTTGATQSWWQIDCALLHIWTTSTYDPVLNVVNQVTTAWNVSLQVYGSSNIARLSSAAISLHDGTSSQQIVVNGGSIVQSQGALFNLLGGSGTTIYVSISNLLANSTGTSYLYAYLEILTPNTSTFLAYAVTFAIT